MHLMPVESFWNILDISARGNSGNFAIKRFNDTCKNMRNLRDPIRMTNDITRYIMLTNRKPTVKPINCCKAFDPQTRMFINPTLISDDNIRYLTQMFTHSRTYFREIKQICFNIYKYMYISRKRNGSWDQFIFLR